jgi:deoxycytidylate deaminase
VKLIINAGIRQVIYEQEYQLSDQSIALLNEAGIAARRYQRAE